MKKTKKNKQKHPLPERKASIQQARPTPGLHWEWYVVAALVVITCVVYFQVNSFSFTSYDDNYFITDNPTVQEGLTIDNLIWSFTTFQTGWQPINWLSHLLDCQLFGLWAGGHHLVNLFWHLVNTMLLFFLLYKVTGRLWCSAIVAGLFALHPLHVESVAWISERRDVLSTFWWLMTMWSYAWWVSKRTIALYLLMVSCFALGMMSKPMLVTLPVILLCYDLWPLRRHLDDTELYSKSKLQFIFRLVLEKVPLVIFAAAAGILTMMAVGAEGSLGSAEQYPMLLRLENALVSYLKYLVLTVWPVGLIPHYQFPEMIPFWQVGGACLILLAITACCLWWRTRFPYLAFGWFWYLISLLPVIGIIQQGSGFALADRYTYVPLIGIFIMVAWGGADLLPKLIERRIIATGMVMVLLIFAFLSHRQASYWRNTQTLFEYTLSQDQDNHIALQQLGVYWRDKGDFAKAYQYLEKDVQLNPKNFDALANFGQLLVNMGQLDSAINFYRKAAQIEPYNPEIYSHIGLLLVDKGNITEALPFLRRAVELQPDNASLYLNLGFALFMQQQYNAAENQFVNALRLAPTLADAYNGLGLTQLELGKSKAAIASFQRALILRPGFEHAQKNLQRALGSSN